jgi:hypothetical protein
MKILKRAAVSLVTIALLALGISAVPVYWLPWYPTTSGELQIENAVANVKVPLEDSPFYMPVVLAQERRLANTTLSGTLNYCADAGANDSYACSMVPALPAYATGACYVFKANTVNTGAATLALNGLSALTIVKAAGGITTALADNDIRAGQFVVACYDGTNLQMQSTLGNAAAGSDSGFVWSGNAQEAGLAGSQTTYLGAGKTGFGAQGYVTWMAPADCTARNLRIRTRNGQPADGALVVTLRDETAASDTAVTLTVAAAAGAGLFSDTSNTAAITAGNRLLLKFVNASASTSAQTGEWTLQCN